MRKLGLLALLFAGVAVASGITLTPGVRYEFNDCSSSGSTSQNVKRGTYLFRITDADTSICYASTCASGGEKFPTGTVLQLTFQANTDVSCRSSTSTGDAIFTRGE